MRKTKKNMLATGALVALLLTGCETRMTNPHAAATAALTQRKAYLLERDRIDDYRITTHKETLSLAMRVNNPDRSPVGIQVCR